MTDMERTERILDRLEQVAEKLATVATELAVVADRQAAHATEITRLSGAVQQVRSDLDKWVHRGWGAWGVVVIIFTLVTALNLPDRFGPLLSTPQPTIKRDFPAQPSTTLVE